MYTEDIPISVNNQTEPFLNTAVTNSTLKILEEMEKHGMKNPVMLITKGYIDDKLAKRLSDFKLKIIVLYTFSGLSETFENRDEKRQIETMEILSRYKNIKLVNYYRPVIEGVNTDEKTIKHVTSIVTKYCSESIISGLRVNTNMRKIFKEIGITFPEILDYSHKYLEPDTFERIKKAFRKIDSDYPIFKKTSCGVAYAAGVTDYNGHSARIYYCNPSCISYPICIGKGRIGFCSPDCKNYFRCQEESKTKVTPEQIQKLLKHIGADGRKFIIEEHGIKLEGEYWQEEVSYIRHVTKKNVKADSLIKREDEAKLAQ